MDITQLLKASETGDEEAGQALYNAIYTQLREIAGRHRSRWRGDDTLNTTALVNEAWLKLADGATQEWQSRGHFFAVASAVMRQILVDKARKRSTIKRGNNPVHVPLDEESEPSGELTADLAARVLAIHDRLAELETRYPRQAKVVECRFFGGLEFNEISEALGISPSTVRRDWELAKIALYRSLTSGPP
jgi:RNA polymerase sigma factor (TIGR02999 family)